MEGIDYVALAIIGSSSQFSDKCFSRFEALVSQAFPNDYHKRILQMRLDAQQNVQRMSPSDPAYKTALENALFFAGYQGWQIAQDRTAREDIQASLNKSVAFPTMVEWGSSNRHDLNGF